MVSSDLVYPEDIDRALNWPLGTTARLARRHELPHYVLPDGSIRFSIEEIEALVRHVPANGHFRLQSIRGRPTDASCPESDTALSINTEVAPHSQGVDRG
jgi:hypothetical protein